jgi:methionyl-tRNA formyltransferase
VNVILLSSHPLADHHPHKGELLNALVKRGDDVAVLYAGTRLRDYTGELRRRRPSDVFKVVHQRRSPSNRIPSDDRRALGRVAQDLHVQVSAFPTLEDPRALHRLVELKPDVVLNLSALYIPQRFLLAAESPVVGAHYAALPRLRGGDTIRWSILLDAPLCVSHQVLTAELDMGDVVGWSPVEVELGDDITTLRRKCQVTSVAGYLDVVERLERKSLVRHPQRASGGSTFFRMGAFLRARVDKILRTGSYTHYGSRS